MQVDLVFSDWQRDGHSIYYTEEGVELSLGEFHSGTVFAAEIALDLDGEEELTEALAAGAIPLFYAVPASQ